MDPSKRGARESIASRPEPNPPVTGILVSARGALTMTGHPCSLDLETLLGHADFVRALARALLSDPDSVEEVVQRTWIAALERPPATAGTLKGWLSTVVRNFARQLARGEERRRVREHEAGQRVRS